MKLSSPGGLVKEAFAIADLIANSRVEIFVDGDCASACAPHRFNRRGTTTSYERASLNFRSSWLQPVFVRVVSRCIRKRAYL